MPQLPTATKSGESNQEAILKAAAYDGLKTQEKALKKQIKESGDELRSYLKDGGIVDPNNDNVYIKGDYLGRKVTITHQARKSTSFVPEVEELLQDALSEEDFDDVFESVKVLREDLLEQKIVEGKISEELLDRITNVKTTYALKVDVK